MATDLAATTVTPLTDEEVHGAALMAGEASEPTRRALEAALPTALAGLTVRGATVDGVAEIARWLEAEPVARAAAGDAGAILHGGAATQRAIALGQEVLHGVFGPRLPTVGALLARASGVRSTSAILLASLAAVLTLAGLRRELAGGGAASLADALRAHRVPAAGLAPAGLAEAMGVHSVAGGGAPVAGALPPARSPLVWVLPIFLAVAIVSAIASHVVGSSRTGGRERAVQVELPGGAVLTVAEGSFAQELSDYLAGGDSAEPQAFVFDQLAFESGSAALTPDSAPTVEVLAAILRAYPSVRVRLEGHTDSVGDSEANRQLSRQRAAAVKAMLAAAGVESLRMTTEGFGQDRPIASNDTDEGRARNRRLELVVVER